DGDLALGVGPDEGQLAAFAHAGVVLDQAVGQVDGQGHQGVGFLAGEAEHHALVAGPAGVHAGGDVGGLLVQVALDLAGVGGEADGGVHVADLADRVADQAVDGGAAEVGGGGDLAGDDGQVGGDEGFAGNPAEGVGGQAVVQDGVADLVGHLVG